MRNGFLLSAALLLSSAGMAHAQVMAPSPQPPPAVSTSEGAFGTDDTLKPGLIPQLKLEHSSGTSIRFGTLTQLQYEAKGRYADHEVSQNFLVRRFMLLIGGNLWRHFEYFIDTDFVDMLKASGEQSLKNGPGFSVKDVLITWRAVGDALKVDGGLMLPPGSRTSLQGAPFLFGLDFFNNAYTHAALFGTTSNSFGRDLGLQLRGLVLKGRVEYRAGVFKGRRGAPRNHAASRNPFRFAARLQFHVFDPETAFFMRGTYLREKKILTFGGAIDVQHTGGGTFLSGAADMLLELAGVTAQFDYVYRDGGGFLDLPKQHALMAEAGYFISSLRLAPIVRVERRWGRGATVDETDFGGGLSFFLFGHTSNLKAYYIRGRRDDQPDYDQFVAQWQLFFY